ncbi:MAG: DNA repair protein RecO [Trueperaceae bacterium]|nr:MAG: DNA repair protein RecO [Trueperaceae bacterium]
MSRRYRVRDGIIIRRNALPNGDIVATILGEKGKWHGIARKGKIPGGNLGRLSLFHDVTIQYYRRGEEALALITQVQLNGALSRLSQPDVYPYAHILAELADALSVEVEPGGQIYDYLASGLRGLNQHRDTELVALAYAWKLTAQAGLAPQVATCTHCKTTSQLAFFDIAGGGLGCQQCRVGLPLLERQAAEVQQLVRGSVRTTLDMRLPDRALHWRILHRYLAYHVRPLKSLINLSSLTETYKGEASRV